MSTPSIKIGQGNWGIKAGNLLGYANTDKKFVAREFTVGRLLDTATRVNASGNIEGVNANIPRIDYFGGQASLLVEPSAVNLCLQSAAFATSPWVLTTATSPNTTATTDPFGQTNADLFTATANFGKTQQQVTRTASGTHTVSCFVKGVAGVASIGSLIYNRGVGFTITSGGVVTVNAPVGYTQAATIGVENYGNGWYRIFAVLTHFTTPSTDGILIDSSVSGNSFYIFGAQVEAGSVATSYIPTTTGTVTRNADVISVTGVAGLIGQTQGTIYAEVVAVSGVNTSRVISVTESGAPTNNRIAFSIDSTNHRLEIIVRSNGSITSGSIGSSAATLLANGVNKIAYAYDGVAGSNALAINGSVVATNSQAFSFTQALSRVNVAILESDLTVAANQRIRAVSIYQTRLPNTTTDGSPSLQSITTL